MSNLVDGTEILRQNMLAMKATNWIAKPFQTAIFNMKILDKESQDFDFNLKKDIFCFATKTKTRKEQKRNIRIHLESLDEKVLEYQLM